MHIVPPFGKTFITGLASSYALDSYNPELLSQFITDREYAELIDRINSTLIEYWPCTPCQLIGYLFCPCTLGLSFLFPGVSISEANEKVHQLIKRINKDFLSKRKLKLSLTTYCSTSWLEIHIED